MNKMKTGWKLPPLPLPVALLGANVSGKANFFTIVWFTMLQDDPPLIGAAMSKTHYTRQGVDKNKTFSINIPSSPMVEVVDYCGLYSGSKVDKSTLFDIFYGELGTAPMAKECAINIECRLVESKELNTTVLMIGEVAEVYCEEKYLTDNKPDYHKIDPMVFFMPAGPYLKIGKYIAEAFEVGKGYRK